MRQRRWRRTVKHYSGEDHVNVGSAEEVTIAQLAQVIAEVVGFAGRFDFDSSKPDGTPRKLLDSKRLHDLGWDSRTDLREGISRTYQWLLERAKSTDAFVQA